MKKLCAIIWLSALFLCFFNLTGMAADASQENRFVKHEDNTVIDTKTSLMWATKDNQVDTNWDDAKSFCDNYSAGGYTDWRLPTIDELTTIFDSSSTKRYQTVNEITLSACCPWSSDTRRKRARAIFFIGGETNTFSKKLSTDFRALPVRNAQ